MAATTTTARPDWEELYRVAEAQAGHFTTSQAAEAGISTALIAHHLGSNTIRRVRRGIYRLTRFPMSDHEHLVVLWLWSDRKGTFSHETALVLHSLSDALPGEAHLTVPEVWGRRRLRVPGGLRLHFSDLDAADLAWFDCLPITSPTRTVLDLDADHADPILLEQAVDEGARRGLFTRDAIRRARRSGRTR